MGKAEAVAILLFSVGGALLAQDAAKRPGLAYLVDDATRIYVVDESRCSAAPNSKEGGRWYLIESDEKIGRLRKELSEVAAGEGGGCLCGGPDVHFYAAKPSGETRYFGLDCERFLDGNSIPSSLQSLLVPSRPTFIGTRKGETYIVDIALDTEEPAARRSFADAGFTLVVGGWWNMFTDALPRTQVLRRRASAIAPVHLRVEAGPFKAIRPKPVLPKERTEAEEMEWDRAWYCWHEENEASTTRSAKGRIETWIERLKLQGALFGDVEPRFTMSSGDETTYSADLLFNDAEAVQKALGDPQMVQEGLRVQQADYRSAQEMQAKFYYQAALLLPESPSRETLMKAEHVLPGIRRIVPLCDCREGKEGEEPPGSERKIFAMGEIKSLRLLTEVKPLYPAAALASKIGGKVVLELIVNEKGDVENARVLNSANPLLDDSALAAVKQYKFSAPTTDKGQVVNAYWIVSVNYEP